MGDKETCLFCDIYKKNIDIINETGYFYSQFDKFPVSPGHAEVIQKRHVVSLLDLTVDEWRDLQKALQDTVKIIESTDMNSVYEMFIKKAINEKSVMFCKKMLTHIGIDKKPDAYNFGNNDGEAAGRTIHHLHYHIIPRYIGDVPDPRGGIRHIIPGLGNYRK